jgi:hypothetical protein
MRLPMGFNGKPWTRGGRYQRALANAGAMRIGLDGKVVEPVSAEHQAAAVSRLAAMKTKSGQ